MSNATRPSGRWQLTARTSTLASTESNPTPHPTWHNVTWSLLFCPPRNGGGEEGKWNAIFTYPSHISWANREPEPETEEQARGKRCLAFWLTWLISTYSSGPPQCPSIFFTSPPPRDSPDSLIHSLIAMLTLCYGMWIPFVFKKQHVSTVEKM